MRSGFLEQVSDEARERVAADLAVVSLDRMVGQADRTPVPPSFAEALRTPVAGAVAAIAEIKRASPSRGHMADIPHPAELASAYVAGGASAISVLTEPRHFAGDLRDLEAVAATVPVPVIRKDFVVDAYQIWQARAAGGSAVLLIVAALQDDEMVELMAVADQAGLDCLVETHSAAEVARGVTAHGRAATGRGLVLGVNARDLVTLEVDRAHVARVRAEMDLPEGALLVAESGIRGRADVEQYQALGADAILVGEHVATASDPEAAVRALLG